MRSWHISCICQLDLIASDVAPVRAGFSGLIMTSSKFHETDALCCHVGNRSVVSITCDSEGQVLFLWSMANPNDFGEIVVANSMYRPAYSQ